jgi:hypothetical protein
MQTGKKTACPNYASIASCERGSAMVFVLVLAVILNIVIVSVSFSSRYTTKKGAERRSKVSALNIAEAGKERFYAHLLREGFEPQPGMQTVYSNESFGNGAYTVRCSLPTGSPDDTMTIWADGIIGSSICRIEVLAVRQKGIPLTGIGALVNGAVTSRAAVTLSGTITVDGRDFDTLGTLAGTGVFGVYTCMTLIRQGNATIGGNGTAPLRGVNTTVAFQNASIEPYLSSPEAFLGLPPGGLDAFKVRAADVTYPIKGIVYVEGDFQPNFNTGPPSRGILIVSNSTRTAEMRLNGNGQFQGLIICDVMNRINGTADVLGGIVTLGTVTGSQFGNGTATIRYSSQVLDNLAAICTNIPWTIKEVAWRELP